MESIDVVYGSVMVALTDLFRIMATLLAAYNLAWTWPGMRELSRGHVWPPSIYLSTIFWFSAAAILYQVVYFIGGTLPPGHPARLLTTMVLLIPCCLAMLGHRIGSNMKVAQFYDAYNHLPEVMAMVELARADPEAARALAATALRQAAQAITRIDD